jgi:hypothetical protein
MFPISSNEIPQQMSSTSIIVIRLALAIVFLLVEISLTRLLNDKTSFQSLFMMSLVSIDVVADTLLTFMSLWVNRLLESTTTVSEMHLSLAIVFGVFFAI